MEIVDSFILVKAPLTSERKILAEKFNDVAEIFRQEFPSALARLAVVVTDFDALPYVSPEVAAELTEDVAKIKPVISEISEILDRRNATGLAQHGCNIAGTPVSLVALHRMNDLFRTHSDPADREMWGLFLLIHELAHLILKNGSGRIKGVSQHLAESACDALAMLLHIQLYGLDTKITRDAMMESAINMTLHKEDAHYTANTLQRVIEVAAEKGKNFFRLSLREMTTLAEEIAESCALDETSLHEIRDAYELAGLIHAKAHEGNTHTVKDFDKLNTISSLTILLVMKQNRDNPDIVRAGKQALEMPAFRQALDKAQPDWRDEFNFTDTYKPLVQYRHAGTILKAGM